MLHCDNCHVQIRGYKESCPLCGGELSGNPEDPAFPVLKQRRYTSREIMKIALFILCVLFVIMGTIRYLMGPRAAWTSAVMLWSPLAMVGLIITMAYRYHILKLISAEAFVAMILNLLIDHATGDHGWALGFVVPSLFVGLALTNLIISLCMHYPVNEYLVYLLLPEALSFLQFIFVRNGMNPYPAFAVVSMAFMLILIIGEFIFLYRDFRNVTSKTLHL